MLYIITLEPFEDRYTKQWHDWFLPVVTEYLNDVKAPFTAKYIDGDTTYASITLGSFLDVAGTSLWKNEQLVKISKMFKDGTIKEGDIFFFMDAWFPGVESIRYMAQGLDIKVFMFGCLHAGTYDEYDFLTQHGMRPWGMYFETVIHEVFDKTFFATTFSRDLYTNNTYKFSTETTRRILIGGKELVTGFPMYRDFVPADIKPWDERENIVVFPHRMDLEKGSFYVEKASELLQAIGYTLVIAVDNTATKKEYYDLLGRAKFTVSFSSQETWGIAMQEATYMGSIPIVPNKLSYKEMYYKEFVYTSSNDKDLAERAVERIEEISTGTNQLIRAQDLLEAQQTLFYMANESAIYKMMVAMYSTWARR